MRIINMNNNNIVMNPRQKLITFFETFINILIIIPILCFFYILNKKVQK